MTDDTFIIPDIHGNWRLALGLLEQEGLIEYVEDLPRRQHLEHRVVQLGDLCNCVRGSINDDLQAVKLVGPIIDVMLIGNHEHPYFGGIPFDGFAYYMELKNEILKLNDRNLIQAALEVDGIMFSHAGVVQSADGIEEWRTDNKAADFAESLCTLWLAKEYTHAMFNTIGQARGGRFSEGGVLWADWKEPKTTQFPQIFGHTVGKTWRAEGSVNGVPNFTLIRPYADATPMQVQTLCLDIGAGKTSRNILGCWIRNGRVEIVEYEQAA